MKEKYSPARCILFPFKSLTSVSVAVSVGECVAKVIYILTRSLILVLQPTTTAKGFLLSASGRSGNAKTPRETGFSTYRMLYEAAALTAELRRLESLILARNSRAILGVLQEDDTACHGTR